MSVFVTGSTGLIGSHLCKRLTDEGKHVVALVRDVVPSKWFDDALSRCVKVSGDVMNFSFMKRVIAQYEVNGVYHLAALAKVKTAFKEPLNVYGTNVLGTVNVLEACRQLDVERVLIMITDKVFGERENARSEDPLQASEPYATSKICAQYTAQSYMNTYGLDVVIARSCNVYGLDYANRIIPNTIRKALRGESPIIFSGETNTIRQYIHVHDLVDALILLMNQTSRRRLEGYNICTDDILNQEDVVLKILEFFPNLEPEYVKRKNPQKEISRQTMVLSDFGWDPKISFSTGIENTIEMFKEYGY